MPSAWLNSPRRRGCASSRCPRTHGADCHLGQRRAQRSFAQVLSTRSTRRSGNQTTAGGAQRAARERWRSPDVRLPDPCQAALPQAIGNRDTSRPDGDRRALDMAVSAFAPGSQVVKEVSHTPVGFAAYAVKASVLSRDPLGPVIPLPVPSVDRRRSRRWPRSVWRLWRRRASTSPPAARLSNRLPRPRLRRSQ